MLVSASERESFSGLVRPLSASKCSPCHSASSVTKRGVSLVGAILS